MRPAPPDRQRAPPCLYVEAPLVEALAGARREPGPWAVLTGPEGGFAAEEIAALARVPEALRLGLGLRTLRAETATIAARACLQALAGDWRVAKVISD